MILGLFSQKNLKINIDRKLYSIVHFYLDFLCHKMCIAFLIIAKDCDACIQVFGQSPGSAPDAAMILGLFSQKKLKINIDRKLY
jgi:hypothetical protein